jgi:hypothetical protein
MHACDRSDNQLNDGDVVEFLQHGQLIYGEMWGMHCMDSENYGACTLIIEFSDGGPKKIKLCSNRDVRKVSDEKALLWKLENA